MKGDLQSALVDLRRDEAMQIAIRSLDEGADPLQLLIESRDGIEQVMQRYERKQSPTRPLWHSAPAMHCLFRHIIRVNGGSHVQVHAAFCAEP